MNQQVANKIFNLGFSKTGTTTVEDALHLLGYRVCRGHWQSNYTNYLMALYMSNEIDEIVRLAGYWDAFADGPWGGSGLYLSLVEHFPEAHYIMSRRDPEKWYKSFENMFMQFDRNPKTAMDTHHAMGRYGATWYFKKLFGIDSLDGTREKIIDQYNARNEEIIEFFSKTGRDLLVLDVTSGDGWEVLCPYLGVPVPAMPFPHANRGSYKANG